MQNYISTPTFASCTNNAFKCPVTTTESEEFALEGTIKGHVVPALCNEQRHFQLDQIAQSSIQPDLECFPEMWHPPLLYDHKKEINFQKQAFSDPSDKVFHRMQFKQNVWICLTQTREELFYYTFKCTWSHHFITN